jgi:protein phosphatase
MTSRDTPATAASVNRKPAFEEIDAFGLTHLGKVRKVNQDHFLLCSLSKQIQVHYTSLPNVDQLPLESERLAYLAMVADGVGSGWGGEEASRLAIEVVAQYVAHSMRCYYTADATNEGQFFDALQQAAMQCHEIVVQKAQEDANRRGMATTLTVWIGVWPQSYLLQIGDSRCYLYGDGKLSQISRDQTMAEELIDQGVLTRTGAHDTRWAHVLSSAIGGSQAAPVVTSMEQAWDHVGLLCSDGLTKHVSDEQIGERLRTMKSARQVCKDLLQDALDAGGSDNITIVVGRATRRDTDT